jgi:hypothetical protein
MRRDAALGFQSISQGGCIWNCVAAVKFESAGTEICVDATIQGFDPVLAHLHNAQPGVNGPLVVNFSSTRVAPGDSLDVSPCPYHPWLTSLVSRTL